MAPEFERAAWGTEALPARVFGNRLLGSRRFDGRARRGARWHTGGGGALRAEIRSRALGLGAPRHHRTKK